MRTRSLCTAGPYISLIGFGAMALSPGIYGEVNDERSMATLRRTLELGINLIDTADVYGAGHNEQLVGRVVAGERDRVILASKFGGNSDEHGAGVPGLGRPENVRQACEASLDRLRTDHIDLYYLHRVDPATPIEDTVGAMGQLVEQGKVRYLGLSEVSAPTIRRAHTIHPITAVQTEYSLFAREPEETVLPACHDLGIGFVAYSPLGRGFLSGQLRRPEDLSDGDWRRGNPRFQGQNFIKNVELADAVREMAESKGISPAQLALAWLIHQDTTPIPGSRHAANMEQNALAAEVTLSSADLDHVNSILPPGAVAGDRADPAYLANVDR